MIERVKINNLDNKFLIDLISINQDNLGIEELDQRLRKELNQETKKSKKESLEIKLNPKIVDKQVSDKVFACLQILQVLSSGSENYKQQKEKIYQELKSLLPELVKKWDINSSVFVYHIILGNGITAQSLLEDNKDAEELANFLWENTIDPLIDWYTFADISLYYGDLLVANYINFLEWYNLSGLLKIYSNIILPNSYEHEHEFDIDNSKYIKTIFDRIETFYNILVRDGKKDEAEVCIDKMNMIFENFLDASAEDFPDFFLYNLASDKPNQTNNDTNNTKEKNLNSNNFKFNITPDQKEMLFEKFIEKAKLYQGNWNLSQAIIYYQKALNFVANSEIYKVISQTIFFLKEEINTQWERISVEQFRREMTLYFDWQIKQDNTNTPDESIYKNQMTPEMIDEKILENKKYETLVKWIKETKPEEWKKIEEQQKNSANTEENIFDKENWNEEKNIVISRTWFSGVHNVNYFIGNVDNETKEFSSRVEITPRKEEDGIVINEKRVYPFTKENISKFLYPQEKNVDITGIPKEWKDTFDKVNKYKNTLLKDISLTNNPEYETAQFIYEKAIDEWYLENIVTLNIGNANWNSNEAYTKNSFENIFPKNITKLKNIKELVLNSSDNEIDIFPKEIRDMENIETIKFKYVKTISDEIIKLKNLKKIDISTNDYESELPISKEIAEFLYQSNVKIFICSTPEINNDWGDEAIKKRFLSDDIYYCGKKETINNLKKCWYKSVEFNESKKEWDDRTYYNFTLLPSKNWSKQDITDTENNKSDLVDTKDQEDDEEDLENYPINKKYDLPNITETIDIPPGRVNLTRQNSSYQINNNMIDKNILVDTESKDILEVSDDLSSKLKLQTFANIWPNGFNTPEKTNFVDSKDMIKINSEKPANKYMKINFKTWNTPIPIPEWFTIKEIRTDKKDSGLNLLLDVDKNIWEIVNNSDEDLEAYIIFEPIWVSVIEESKYKVSAWLDFEKKVCKKYNLKTLQDIDKYISSQYFYCLSNEVSNMYAEAWLKNEYFVAMERWFSYKFTWADNIEKTYTVKAWDCDQVNSLAVRFYQSIGIPARLIFWYSVNYEDKKIKSGNGHGRMEYYDKTQNKRITNDLTASPIIDLENKSVSDIKIAELQIETKKKSKKSFWKRLFWKDSE